MFETSAFHEDCYAMRQIYRAGGFGALVYSEGEYHHYSSTPIPSYKNWRLGAPPQWYPTHANAYFVCVTNGSFTEVSCLGMPSLQPRFQPQNNAYKNTFGTEIALMRTSEGGMARMAGSRDIPDMGSESGRVYGQRGWMAGMVYHGEEKKLPGLERPPLPPSVATGHHGGSSGFLMNEFVTAILEDRSPMVDIVAALNMTVAGVVAHQSAVKGGRVASNPAICAAEDVRNSPASCRRLNCRSPWSFGDLRNRLDACAGFHGEIGVSPRLQGYCLIRYGSPTGNHGEDVHAHTPPKERFTQVGLMEISSNG